MPLPPRVEVKGRKSSFCPPLLFWPTRSARIHPTPTILLRCWNQVLQKHLVTVVIYATFWKPVKGQGWFFGNFFITLFNTVSSASLLRITPVRRSNHSARSHPPIYFTGTAISYMFFIGFIFLIFSVNCLGPASISRWWCTTLTHTSRRTPTLRYMRQVL